MHSIYPTAGKPHTCPHSHTIKLSNKLWSTFDSFQFRPTILRRTVLPLPCCRYRWPANGSLVSSNQRVPVLYKHKMLCPVVANKHQLPMYVCKIDSALGKLWVLQCAYVYNRTDWYRGLNAANFFLARSCREGARNRTQFRATRSTKATPG